MKKTLAVLGAVFLAIVAVVAIALGWGYYSVWASEGDATSYVDRTVQAIVTDWNIQAFIAESSPELLQVAPSDKMRPIFETFSTRLGPLKAYNGATRERYYVNLVPWNRFITFSYTADATFEKGPAKIRIGIIRRGGQWKLTDFFVVSDTLMPR